MVILGDDLLLFYQHYISMFLLFSDFLKQVATLRVSGVPLHTSRTFKRPRHGTLALRCLLDALLGRMLRKGPMSSTFVSVTSLRDTGGWPNPMLMWATWAVCVRVTAKCYRARSLHQFYVPSSGWTLSAWKAGKGKNLLMPGSCSANMCSSPWFRKRIWPIWIQYNTVIAIFTERCIWTLDFWPVQIGKK